MDFIVSFLTATLDIFQIPITVFGFTFSLWDAFIWSALASIVLNFVLGCLLD